MIKFKIYKKHCVIGLILVIHIPVTRRISLKRQTRKPHRPDNVGQREQCRYLPELLLQPAPG